MKLKYISGGICAPTGFTAGATHCGVRPNKKKNDLAIILSDRNTDCVSAGLYTTNRVKSAPSRWAASPRVPEWCIPTWEPPSPKPPFSPTTSTGDGLWCHGIFQYSF